eukprot:2655317-Pleurochrysis_carterae.AAC.1
MSTRTHAKPLLSADGRIQRNDAHVRSRDASNSRSAGLPISPPLSRMLWARSAAAHSNPPRGVQRS